MNRFAVCGACAAIGLLALASRVGAENEKVKPEDFINRAMEWNACEKGLAETAAKSAANDEVRKFAQRLADDHAKFEKDLGEAIKEKKFAVASTPNKAERDKVAEISKLK